MARKPGDNTDHRGIVPDVEQHFFTSGLEPDHVRISWKGLTSEEIRTVTRSNEHRLPVLNRFFLVG